MKVSLNWIKKYVDLPKDITNEQIMKDLTIRTVEVEDMVNTGDKFKDIVVGKIIEVNPHPNADLLKVCLVDIGEDEYKQIVCGGENLYPNELVVISKPGAMVYWHGEGDLVEIKETKMRGVSSYGMICGATEVYLSELFPPKNEKEIVDLTGLDVKPGENISDALNLGDTILEIDNKSLSNRPDLWGHYGIARELSVIYNVPLKELEINKPNGLPEYKVSIEEKDKCKRYAAVKIEGVIAKESPSWMKTLITNAGMRPINAIVDITNYVMMAIGQPTHAFDSTHVKGEKIVVRNARENEKLLLLDNNELDLTTDDLVICDESSPLALAGIRGGKEDSILPETTSVVLEVANFSAAAIRKTGKRFAEKTDASIRYEKGIDTQRVDLGISLALELFKEIFPQSKIVAFKDEYLEATPNNVIDVTKKFLDDRLGKVISNEEITRILTGLGYEVSFDNDTYHVVVPTFRSTGDVTLKDDVMGDIARLLGYDSFEKKPLTINFEHAVLQNDVLLERRLKEYLSYRCGFNEIITYPWIDEKYIDAAGLDKSKMVMLATPPSPEQAYLRASLVPGLLEAISKNLRYFDEFRIYEMTEVFEKGEYHESSEDETLPIHKNYLSGAIVKKDAKSAFYEIKGVIESMSSYVHMESLSFRPCESSSYLDKNAKLDIYLGDILVGSLGLLSVKTMADSKIKRTNVGIFEINVSEFIPYPSRTNEFKHLPEIPLVEKDLSILVDEDVTWEKISKMIRNKVSEYSFVEEYRGEQVPTGKKSVTFKVKLGDGKSTLTSDDINHKLEEITITLNRTCGATIREV
ncbi:MAG: phenylalanine--tRNA ligase subunit beta [Tenericutes bacterium]|nr:phenylalanine--tRNA ligase subunit beta [Mycoplasmatota bacterium]